MDEKEQLGQIIQEYDVVVSHYENYSIMSRGAIRPGEARTQVYDKRYSGTKEFIAWTTRIRYFLERSAAAGSDEANDIVAFIDSFKGFGEESKMTKLLDMLSALYDNWDLVSQPHNTNTSIGSERQSNVVASKFEFKCNDRDESKKTFTLKNVSSVIVSNIIAESFELIHLDDFRQDVLPFGFQMPTSLGPNETGEFTINNRAFERRGVGFKEFQFVFSFEDEQSNRYRCIATKNVEDERNYMRGIWKTQVYEINAKSKSITKGATVGNPTVFISYNWDSGKTADEVEARLSPISTVLRDKSSIGPWGSIGEFMKSIRKTDLAVVIISDAYLKSVACLYEIMQLLKDDNWISHSMFLVEDSAKGVYSAIGQLEYVKYWATERANLEKALEGINPALVTSQAEELKKIQLIQLNINDFMKSVADRNNPDLSQAIEVVEKRVKLNSREEETEGDICQPQLNTPIFDVKIVALNQLIPGTAEVVDIWDGKPLPKHKNVRFQIELCNDVTIRNLKVFGRSIESGIVKQNKQHQITVCYMESPDTRWEKHVFELSRASYPAGEDGIPKVVQLEYAMDQQIFQQLFTLGVDQTYIPGEQENVIPKDIEKVIQTKERMRKEFLKPTDKLKQYSREELWKHPEKRFISDEVIVISIECKDPKWNTDGGSGKYEIYDFCDEGLLCWDNTGFKAQVKYYNGEQLSTASVNRMLCLPYEKVFAYDLYGNSGYNMPIIHADYQIGESPFQFYYRDMKSETIIDNGVIVDVMPST